MFIETCYTHHGHRIQSENLIQKITCTVEYIYALKSGVGRDHQKGSEGLSFLLWTQTSVQTSCLTNWWGGGGTTMELDMDMPATVVLMCTDSPM